MENIPQLFGRSETFQAGLGDLDGDGDLDAVLANMAANDSQVWLNDGRGTFYDSGQKLTRQGHGLGLGDLDGDGDLDILMTCAHFRGGGGWSKKPSRVYLNDGQGVFHDSGQDLGDAELSGNGVNLIDLDGDGDMDAHVIYYEVGGMPDRVYLNDGAGRFDESGLALAEEEIAWGDLDGDGDVDMLAKAYGQGYRVYLNDGAGQFVAGWQMEDSQAMYGDLALADLDGDGDLDALIASGFRSEGSLATRLMWNDGTGQFEDSGQQLNKTMGARLAVGDLDGDGNLDVFVANMDRLPSEAWLNDGTGRLVDSGLRLESPSRHLATWPTLGDLDGDGDLDLVEAGFQGKAEVWLNQALSSATAVPGASPDPSALGKISIDTAQQVEILSILSGHDDRVIDLGFSGDGDYLASSSLDRTIKLWDVASGQEVQAFPMNKVGFNGIALSLDGRLLASADRLWDLDSKQEIYTLTQDRRDPGPVAFVPDGSILAVALEGQPIRLWNVADGQVMRTFEGQIDEVTFSLAFSPDGMLLAAGVHGGKVRLWAVASGQITRTLEYGSVDDDAHEVAFSPDGKLLAAVGTNQTARVWDVAGGETVHTLRHGNGLYGVAFSPDGSLLATAVCDRTVKLWDVATGRLMRTLPHGDEVMTVAFSPDGTLLASGGYDNQVYLWGIRRSLGAIAFSSRREGSNGTDIYVMKADGSNLRQLTELTTPSWHPVRSR